MRERPDIFLSIAAEVPDEVVSDFLEQAAASGFNQTLERREPEVFAAIEWLLPTTAVMLFLSRKFIDTFAEEAAKDAYPFVKASFLRLIRRTSGANRVINSTYISSPPGKAPAGPTSVLTVLVIAADGRRAHFRFPPDLPDSLHATALEGLLTAAKQFELSKPESSPEKNIRSSWRPKVLTFDSSAAAWREVDLLLEAQAARERFKDD
jgi:hypothetical protein